MSLALSSVVPICPNSFTSMTSMPTWPDFRRYTSIKAMSLQELVGDVCARLSASRATQSIMQILQFRSRYSEAFLTLLERLAESCWVFLTFKTFAPGWNLDDGELLHEFHLPSAGPSRSIGFCVLSKLCLSHCSLNSSWAKTVLARFGSTCVCQLVGNCGAGAGKFWDVSRRSRVYLIRDSSS